MAELSKNIFWQLFLKNGLAVFLIANYIIINYLEAFLDVNFLGTFKDNSALGAVIGIVFFFAKEVVLLIDKSPYKFVKREVPANIGKKEEEVKTDILSNETS